MHYGARFFADGRLPNFNKIMVKAQFETMQAEYAGIVGRHCTSKDDNIWAAADNPLPVVTQGIKIHVAATIFSAARMLDKCLPVILASGMHFKVVKSLIELKKLNCGLHYGISQIGKFITIYCHTETIAAGLMEKLHLATLGEDFVQIPYDLQYRKNSCVFYRYGAFSSHIKINRRGKETDGIINIRTNKPVPDERSFGRAFPKWYPNPIPFYKEEQEVFRNYIIYKSLSQRGKGGVYAAVKWDEEVLREVIIKEGRKNGEIDIDGTDGFRRVHEEFEVLKAGTLRHIRHPELIEAFTLNGHFYLVLEKIKGDTLQNWVMKNKKTNKLPDFLDVILQMTTIVGQMHDSGMVWRDCKPSNMMRDENGVLRPIDMEGVSENRKQVYLFGSEGFIAPEANSTIYEARPENDVYAIGASMFFILTRQFLKANKSNLSLLLRKRIPARLKQIVSDCLNDVPEQRPSMADVRLMVGATAASCR